MRKQCVAMFQIGSRRLVHLWFSPFMRNNAHTLMVAAELFVLALFFEISLLVITLPQLVHIVRRLSRSRTGSPYPLIGRHINTDRLIEIAGAVAYRLRGRDACLPRSLLLLWLLRSADNQPKLVLGVRHDSSEPFMAHAWIEDCERPIAECSDILARYSVIARY